jgi:DNA polymerase-3 subunit gamma/tau
MVQTLGNAIARGRLAQAWLLTGVRGVGKTSTARIIAKALNCIGADGQGGPTINPCGVCEPCTAIAAGRHMDVVEMDAASNTGVDDVREIIEGVRYAAVSARYKIHIIDEVHMLSKAAFNALLKTLEEPPPGVKFIMATTEVNKVPATILSRCQRFDLKRVPAEMLADHFARILEQEQVQYETDALALVARAAEGSVRDGLSILDQAIAHSGETITADAVRDMLGLADRGAVRALFGHVLEGRVGEVMAAVARQYDLGQDPAQLMRELLGLVHGITRQRLAQAWIGLRIMRLNALRTLSGHQAGTLSRAASITKLYWATWHRDLGKLAPADAARTTCLSWFYSNGTREPIKPDPDGASGGDDDA